MTAKNREENLELPYKIAGKQPPKEWWGGEEDKRSGLRVGESEDKLSSTRSIC